MHMVGDKDCSPSEQICKLQFFTKVSQPTLVDTMLGCIILAASLREGTASGMPDTNAPGCRPPPCAQRLRTLRQLRVATLRPLWLRQQCLPSAQELATQQPSGSLLHAQHSRCSLAVPGVPGGSTSR